MKQLKTILFLAFVFVTTTTWATTWDFAKAGVWYFYDSVVLNSSFVHLMKFSAKNPHLRVAAKRYGQM